MPELTIMFYCLPPEAFWEGFLEEVTLTPEGCLGVG